MLFGGLGGTTVGTPAGQKRAGHGSIPGDTPGTLTCSASEGNPHPRWRYRSVCSPGGVRAELPKPAGDRTMPTLGPGSNLN